MAKSSLPQKLRIRAGDRAALFNAPKGFPALLTPLPEGAVMKTSARGPCEVGIGFATTTAEVKALVPRLARALVPGGVLWVCYPKLTSTWAGELSRDVLWAVATTFGLRPVSLVALDDTWSAMRFVPRT